MPERPMSCARQRSNRLRHRCRWALECGPPRWHLGSRSVGWEWAAVWEAARRACHSDAGSCTDIADRKENPAKVGPWRGIETGGSQRWWVEPSVEQMYATPLQGSVCAP